MRQQTQLIPELSIDEILARWPQMIEVFIRFHMLCIGCPVSRFHTLQEACELHQIDKTNFEQCLLETINFVPPQSPKGDAAWSQ